MASGYGIRVAVERGRLLVEDGVGKERLTRRYARSNSKLARLVVLGHAGYISLEAIRWLADLGIPHLHLDADGRLLVFSATGTADTRLRRAQVLAATTDVGACDGNLGAGARV